MQHRNQKKLQSQQQFQMNRHDGVCRVHGSTPLNRARTMAPMTAGFAGGTAVGPAIGGAMANSLGVQGTFLSVGGVYALLVLANKLLLKETMPTKPPASVQPIVPVRACMLWTWHLDS